MMDRAAQALDGESGGWFRALLAVAAALLALRIAVLLGTPLSLHGDEAQYWTWSRDFAFGYYSKPPLIGWVIAASTAVFGDVAWAVRLPAAVFHVGTALVLALTARDMFGARIGFWTGIAWLTLPAVSFSSLIMSTDSILLFFWASTLWAYRAVMTRSGWGPVLALAAAFGLGINAKYAMVYFLLGAAIHIALSADARRMARAAAGRLIVGFAAGVTAILPNVIWNAVNGWATVEHTADNANWQGSLFHFDQLGEFLGAQFGVFGPIFFVVLLLTVPRGRAAAAALSEPLHMLLSFSLPILVLIAMQALLSRAHANWAATAYPAAAILVTAVLLRSRPIWLKASVGLHLAVAGGLYGAVLLPDRVAALAGRDPFAELKGWDRVAERVDAIMAEREIDVLLMDHRMMTAAMAYALRDADVRIRAWNHDAKIDHHYEMAWLYDPATDGGRVLLLTPHGPEAIERRFETAILLDPIPRVDRKGRERPLELRVLETPK